MKLNFCDERYMLHLSIKNNEDYIHKSKAPKYVKTKL